MVEAPRPRSPPRYPDLCGRRRLQLEVQILNREVGFLEQEIQGLERIQPVSRCCKDVNEFVSAKPDPMIPVSKRKHGSCSLFRWISGIWCRSWDTRPESFLQPWRSLCCPLKPQNVTFSYSMPCKVQYLLYSVKTRYCADRTCAHAFRACAAVATARRSPRRQAASAAPAAPAATRSAVRRAAAAQSPRRAAPAAAPAAFPAASSRRAAPAAPVTAPRAPAPPAAAAAPAAAAPARGARPAASAPSAGA